MSLLSQMAGARPRLLDDPLAYAIGLFIVALLACAAARAEEPHPLSLKDALRIASEQSPLLSAQRSAINAAQQATVSARQLPDPKAFFGVENLPRSPARTASA